MQYSKMEGVEIVYSMVSLQIKLKNNYIHLSELFLGVYYLWFFLPFMRTTFSGGYKYFFFLFFLIGIFLLVAENVNVYGLQIKVKHTIIAPILIYMAFMLFLCLFDFHDARDHIRVSFTFWGTALVYYLMGINPDARRRFAQFLIVIAIFTTITSAIVILENPRAARALTSALKTEGALAEDYIFGRKNVSSIYLFQGITALSPVFVYLIKKKHVVWGLLGLTLSFLILLRASFLIALCVMLLGVVLTLIQNEKKSPYLSIVITILALVMLFLPWGEIFGFLAGVINNDTISVRLNELSLLIKFGNVTGDVAARMDVYARSISTLLHHPLGVGPYYFSREAREFIGTHSQILDDFARYGVAAFTFYCVFLKRYYILIKEKWSKIGMGSIASSITIVYAVLLLLNIGFRSAEESVIMLFILPELPEIVLYQKGKKHKSRENYVS